jgi:hypothetical protein
MIKLGLFFEVLGFIMMLWHSVGNPELKFISSDKTRHWILDHFLGLACSSMGIGVIIHLISQKQGKLFVFTG